MHWIQHKNGPSIDVTIGADDTHILRVQLSLNEEQGLRYRWEAPPSEALQEEVGTWMEAYVGKKCSLKAPTLRFSTSSTFRSLVWNQMQQIPFGKTWTYGDIAKRLDRPRSARPVGQACGANPLPLFIPCHRVLGAGSLLGGFSCGLEIKRRLLAHEEISYKS